MTTTHDRRMSISAPTIEFEKPPVAETSLGFYFEKIGGWNALHHGALWERFRGKYPHAEFLPLVIDAPVQPSVGGHLDPKLMLDLLSSPQIRTGFVDESKTQLVQMQNSFFLHNWRKTVDVPAYRRYDEVKAQLRDEWNVLRGYLKERVLKQPAVTCCQMDYFNHLARAEDWHDFADLPKIFTVWSGVQRSTAGATLQMVSFNVSYRFETGVVNAVVQPAIRSTDGKELIQFTLSSSATPANSEDDALFDCLDTCHSNASLVFLDFTTAEARERWKQQK